MSASVIAPSSGAMVPRAGEAAVFVLGEAQASIVIPSNAPGMTPEMLDILGSHARANHRLDSAANVEVAHHFHPARVARLREVVEDAVHRALDDLSKAC